MNRRILLGVTGSIAAYKAAELVRLFVKAGDEVRVVMTPAATEFVSPLTFQTLSRNPVYVEEFKRPMEWRPEHISLADSDLVVVAPATEELVFRVVLQGAFERAARMRFGAPNAVPDPTDEESPGASNRPNALVALTAIVPPALLFALLHASAPEDPSAPQSAAELLYATLCGSVANVLTILICVSFLVIVSRANAGDLGCAARGEGDGGVQTPVLARLIREFSQGLVLYAFVAPVVYLVKITLQNLYPSVIVDPAPILIFALAEGAVYYKSHSFPTVLGMHMGLNATSFLLLCMSIA